MKHRYTLGALLLALLLMAALTWRMEPTAYAAPMAAPTPAAGVVHSPHGGANAAFLGQNLGGVPITADRQTRGINLGDYEKVDLHVVIDQGTTNTTTLKLQFSNDNMNWVDGATVASDIAVDTNTMQQYAIFGRYTRLDVDVANTNTVTITVLGLAK